MSFVPQETDPLLADPNRPSKTQNPPRSVDPNDAQAHADASSELDSDDEAMGTWGTRDERSTWRQRVDYFALACILVGAVLFVGAVWYIVLGAQMKDGNLGMSPQYGRRISCSPSSRPVRMASHKSKPRNRICSLMQVSSSPLSLRLTNPSTAIQSLQSTTAPPGSRLKEKAWKQHQVLLVAFAFPLFAIGSSAIIYNKYKHHGAHFQSVHAKLGLVTLVWMVRLLLLSSTVAN
jgi:hypothetical protein